MSPQKQITSDALGNKWSSFSVEGGCLILEIILD